MRYTLIWYDTEGEKYRDVIEATNPEEAEKKGFEKYHGNPPAKLVSVVSE